MGYISENAQTWIEIESKTPKLRLMYLKNKIVAATGKCQCGYQHSLLSLMQKVCLINQLWILTSAAAVQNSSSEGSGFAAHCSRETAAPQQAELSEIHLPNQPNVFMRGFLLLHWLPVLSDILWQIIHHVSFRKQNRALPSRFSRRKQSTKEHKWAFIFPLWVKKMSTFLRKYSGKLERIEYFVIKWVVRYFSGMIKISPVIYQDLQNVIRYAYKYLKWLLSLLLHL